MGKRISYGELMAPLMAPTIYSDLKPGELVTRGSSTRPCFEVVALWGDKAWIRNIDTDEDAVVDSAGCRSVGGAQH